MTKALPLPAAARSRAGPLGYAEALLLVAASTILGSVIAPRWGNSPVDLIYLPAVLAAAVLAGRGPALLAAIASALAYNYFFTAPYHTLRIHSPADIVTVAVLFLAALVTSHLAASIRQQADLAGAHAARNATIAGFARRLLSCTSEREIADAAVKELGDLFDCNAVLLSGRPEPHAVASEPGSVALTPGDIAAAAAVLATGEARGRGLTPVSTVEWQIHPVRSNESVLAAMALARDDGQPAVGPERSTLLQSLLDQVALALERARLEGEARDFAALRERDRLRSTLLSSIAVDLKPRIAAIGAAAAGLKREGSSDRKLLALLSSEATRLQRYLANLAELGPESEARPLEASGLRIDLLNRAVSRDGESIHLTPKEYAVLAELAKYPGRVLTHSQLLRTVWGPAQERQTEYLRVAVRGLRQKLEREPGRPRMIVNEPAVGYRLVV
jgi:two-component system sensor histidine kinase KdpD